MILNMPEINLKNKNKKLLNSGTNFIEIMYKEFNLLTLNF